MMVTFGRYDEACRHVPAGLVDQKDSVGGGFIELGRLTRRLAVHESVRPASVEAQHPVPDDLKPDAADLAASVRVAPS